ncbi:MAG: hypothetical protein AAF628_11110 [Planctomycetota bacterium]
MRQSCPAILLPLLLAGCFSPASSVRDYAPRPVRQVATWEIVRGGGDAVGWLRLLEIEDPCGRIPFYQVQNRDQQWLGFVDRQGRVYRRVPFAETEAFLGVHPMPKALSLLCEVEAPLTLVPQTQGGPAPAAADVGLVAATLPL